MDPVETESRRGFRVPRSVGSGRRLVVLIIVLGIAAAVGGVVAWVATRSTTSPLVAAEQEFERSSLTYTHALTACRSGTNPLPCETTNELSLSQTFDRF